MRLWKAPAPSMLVTADAGSMHPTQCDSIQRLAHLPQFFEWAQDQQGGSKPPAPRRLPNAAAARLAAALAACKSASEEEASAPAPAPAIDRISEQPRQVAVQRIMEVSIAQWRDALDERNLQIGDGSINTVLYTKLTEVFAAMVDAATLAGNWIVVDRTDGSGSATAELLLELALARGGTKPTILVIDSLERLGKARSSSRSHVLLQQLSALYSAGEDYMTQDPNGTELDYAFDFLYAHDEYVKQSTEFQETPDEKLPFEVIAEHKAKSLGGRCDPNRKWRYFYIDAIFRSGTHIVLKSKDQDEFSVEDLGAQQGFLYAHGDSRTYKRLRANIQQGKPTVMLHNSGGVVTAFSWLQRVMAYMRPPPETSELQGPLRYLIANLSAANWTEEFGVPEIIMMRSLADRAPMLFRKNVVSVDVLKETEEQVLEVITGCFAQAGGVPELGLGNAEVNVIFNTWRMHLDLCENATYHHRWSVVMQWILWLLSIAATLVAVLNASFGSGIIAMHFGLVPFPERRELAHADDETEGGGVMQCAARLLQDGYQVIAPSALEVGRRSLVTADDVTLLQVYLTYAITILPITLALGVTINSRMAWRDKWSVCIMAADTLASEIYKFRAITCEYDQSKPAGKDEDGNDLPPLSQKEKSRRARQLFVSRVQAFHQACITELSQTSTLTPSRLVRGKKVAPKGRFVARANMEEKPTLAQWFKLKVHLEEHFHRTSWAFPQGVSFLTWLSALRPYLSQKTMREEMRVAITSLIEQDKLQLRGEEPLNEAESKLIRRALAAQLGLPPSLFDGVKDDIRVLQRQVVVTLAEEEAKKAMDAVATSVTETGAGVLGGAMSNMMPVVPHGILGGGARVGTSRSATSDAEEIVDENGNGLIDRDELAKHATKMREMLMELQGLGKPKEDEGKALMKIRKQQKKYIQAQKPGRTIEDDYLAGPLSIDTYVCYRLRPVKAKLQRHVDKLSFRLSLMEILGFFVQAAGSVFALFHFSEWVAVTVAIAAVVQSFVEFMQLKNQVTSINLAVRDLQALTVFWDSLSIVRRRTPAVKMQIVKTTEAALLMVVDAHTTASSNTITSVAKKLAADTAEEEANEQS